MASRDVADHFYICLKESHEQRIRTRLMQLTDEISRPGGVQEFYKFSIEYGAYQIFDPELSMDTGAFHGYHSGPR